MAQEQIEGTNGKYFRSNSLNLSQILHFFKTDNVTEELPFRPTGGELFVFKQQNICKKDDWKADGHLWTNQGNRKPLPRSNPKYLKTYFYIKVDGKASKTFKKEVYFPVGDPDKPDEVCIVHYIGNADVSEPTPHGNSKKTQPFFRTKPSVINDLEKRTEVEKAHKVYKSAVCENTTGHEAVSKPRNLKQLQNIRATKQEDIRLSKDAIYNTHEIAYEGQFVHYLCTFPDLCVVVGEREMIDELSNVVKMKDENFLMSYDTTFCLGDFYVSPLVFKHTLFDQNPLVAGLFLIHERKLTETHDIFFKQLNSKVRNLKGIPIVTDMEAAIVRAIKDQTAMKQIGCWRHLRQDVQRWLADNLPKVERSEYINDLYEILRAKTEEQCQQFVSQKKERWHEDFCRYFTHTVEDRLPYFCLWSIQNFCKVDPVNGITTNLSEGFNFLIKVAMQTNGNDCGLYAIANATALAFGKDPSTQVYIPRLMREHLMRCLEMKRMELFPITKGSNSRRKAVKKMINIELFCICKMPDTETLYVLCDRCDNEFHPECVGLEGQVTNTLNFTCQRCIAKHGRPQ